MNLIKANHHLNKILFKQRSMKMEEKTIIGRRTYRFTKHLEQSTRESLGNSKDISVIPTHPRHPLPIRPNSSQLSQSSEQLVQLRDGAEHLERRRISPDVVPGIVPSQRPHKLPEPQAKTSLDAPGDGPRTGRTEVIAAGGAEVGDAVEE